MLTRHLERSIRSSLTDTPVVLVDGARQTGKTTLVQQIVQEGGGWRYVTLDDQTTLSAAHADPAAFVAALGDRAAIDEIQRAPELLPAIKLSVDRRRRAGRFLLTGSADLMTMPVVSESLAGRMEARTLWPFSQGEIEGHDDRFVDRVLGRGPLSASEGIGSTRADVVRRALRGGYPPAYRRSEGRRRDWFAAYLTAMIQRDVRDLAQVRNLSVLPQLLALVATRVGGLMNVSEIARASGVPLTSVQRYLALLEQAFLIRQIPAWSARASRSLARAAKPVFVDPALYAHVAGISAARERLEPTLAGPLLENLVATELWKQIGWAKVRASLLHFRTHGGREVDLVLEADDGRVVGIEVKAAATVGGGDLRGLEALRTAAGERFLRGVVLYTGSEAVAFADDIAAIPMDAVWSAPPSR